MGRHKDLTGQIFGRLTVLRRVENIITKHKRSRIAYECQCTCGEHKIIQADNLLNNSTKSCGCLQKELIKNLNYKYGFSVKQQFQPLYHIWKAMKQRCINPNAPRYKDYGGRGICLCKKWQSNPENFMIWSFIHGWKKGLQLDRINNDGDYEPKNCRFVTPSVNALNSRKKKNNTSGYTGIFRTKSSFLMTVQSNGLFFQKAGFKTKKEALNYRNDLIMEHNFLNRIQKYNGENPTKEGNLCQL